MKKNMDNGFKITTNLNNHCFLSALSTDLDKAIEIFNAFTKLVNSSNTNGGHYLTFQEMIKENEDIDYHLLTEDEILDYLTNCDQIFFEKVRLEKTKNGDLIECEKKK